MYLFDESDSDAAEASVSLMKIASIKADESLVRCSLHKLPVLFVGGDEPVVT